MHLAAQSASCREKMASRKGAKIAKEQSSPNGKWQLTTGNYLVVLVPFVAMDGRQEWIDGLMVRTDHRLPITDYFIRHPATGNTPLSPLSWRGGRPFMLFMVISDPWPSASIRG
jgi:hypothetical protein